MNASCRLRQWVHTGAGLFAWTFGFFYSQIWLVLLSLIPASIRAIQLWNELRTPLWMEVVVELSRVVLFVLIFARLENTTVRQLFRKEFRTGLHTRCVAYLKRSWPHNLIVQMIVFTILMYGLMNLLIDAFVNERTVEAVMGIAGFGHYEYEAASNSMVYFLKNMSIIPMTMVYIARMIGFGAKERFA